VRIALVSDAWSPQVNGVVRTLTALIGELKGRGHDVTAITPDLFTTFPCPTYPEIRLALRPTRKIAALVEGGIAEAKQAGMRAAQEASQSTVPAISYPVTFAISNIVFTVMSYVLALLN